MSIRHPSDLAAARGEPSYVWRDGQERRLRMIRHWAEPDGRRVLEAGCGVGMYSSQIRRRYSLHVEAFDLEIERVREARADTPHALVAAAAAPNINRRVINIGSGTETSITSLVRLIENATGREAHPLYVNAQNGGVSRMCADLSLARELLNYAPQVFLEDGLHRTLTQDERFALRATRS